MGVVGETIRRIAARHAPILAAIDLFERVVLDLYLGGFALYVIAWLPLGWFYPATVVTDITKDMALYTEEVFGPVASMYRAQDIDEAIEIANATTFGLGSNAWTNDEAEQQRFIDDIEAGQVFVNGMTVSYPELGFGGVKRSGYGRELAGLGIREFCNAKTVWVG